MENDVGGYFNFEQLDQSYGSLISAGIAPTQPKDTLDYGQIVDICISPVNDDVIAVCGCKNLSVWDVKNNTELVREETSDRINNVNFSPDGAYVCAYGDSLYIIGVEESSFRWRDSSYRFNEIIWHPKRNVLYFFEKCSVYMVELPLKPTTLFTYEGENVSLLTMTRTGKYLISASSFSIVRVWNPDANELVYEIKDPFRTSYGIYKIRTNFSETLSIFQFYVTLKVYSLNDGKLRATFGTKEYTFNSISSLQFLRRDDYFAITFKDGCILLFDLKTFAMKRFSFNRDAFGEFLSFPYSNRFLNKGEDTLIRIFDLDSKSVVVRYKRRYPYQNRIIASCDFRRFIAYHHDGSIDVFDVE